MEIIKAKHTVGDAVHVRLLSFDDKFTMPYYGHIINARFHKGEHFSDRVLYDVTVGQADAPDIQIINLPHAFIRPGGPEFEEHEPESLLPALGEILKPEQHISESDILKRMDEMCMSSLPPDSYEHWCTIMEHLKSNRRALRTSSQS